MDETARRLLAEVMEDGAIELVNTRRCWSVLGSSVAAAYTAMVADGMPEPVARELARDLLITPMKSK